jgi:hypothetical protein
MREIIRDKIAGSVPKLAPPVRKPQAEPGLGVIPPSSEEAQVATRAKAPQTSQAPTRFPHMISFRVGEDLLSALHNAVASAKDGGDFRFQSVSDVFRAALVAYLDGMPLTVSLPDGIRKKATSCVLSDELKARYDTLPTRSRSQIIERSTRTFLKNGLSWPSKL